MASGWILEDVVYCVTCRCLWTAANGFALYEETAVQAFAGEDGWMRCYFESRGMDADGCAPERDDWTMFGIGCTAVRW